jgi:hypothetical protein
MKYTSGTQDIKTFASNLLILTKVWEAGDRMSGLEQTERFYPKGERYASPSP